MRPIRTFKVRPSLPPCLLPLLEIAYNLRWSWDHAAIELFRRLDRDLWETCAHNPVLLLGSVDQKALEAAAADDSFLAHMRGVAETLTAYCAGESSWYRREHPEDKGVLVAYFSAEFGITECVSVFAGGLGVLAGDHLKAASDLGLPLVGVGLLYQQGYFRQYLNAAGWQQEAYEDNDFHTLPVKLIPDAKVQVELPQSSVAAQIWSLKVGRLRLLLLDTNIPENAPEDRKITYQLYGGDLEMRLKQEILLGIGGYRALEALGLEPTVYHMNEGHSAFLGLERMLRLMEARKLAFREARGPRVGQPDLHHPHTGRRGPRLFPCGDDGPLLRAIYATAGNQPGPVPRFGTKASGARRRGLLYDGARSPVGVVQQWSQQAAWRGFAADVERDLGGCAGIGGADWPRHERGAFSEVGVRMR